MNAAVSDSDHDGHVFVVQADIRHLVCDAWLLPSDTAPSVAEYWFKDEPELLAPVRQSILIAELDSESRRTFAVPVDDQPIPILGAIPVSGTWDASYHVETLKQFIETAIRVCGRVTPSRRLRLAVPAIGTGESGGFTRRGALVGELLQALRRLASVFHVDMVLVLNDRSMAAAARAERRRLNNGTERWFTALSSTEEFEAKALANRAQTGGLVIFTGAGTGVSAGLPDWSKLLRMLGAEANLDVSALEGLNVLDQATLIERSYPAPRYLRERIAKLLTTPRYAVIHALLANLPVRESVTLNYDDLYERARKDCGRAPTILPYEPCEGDDWLLKLHGSVEPDHRDDIVLTRSDYLRLGSHRASLTGLVQALLVTRHMLFVGFGLGDDHFHAVMDDVRRALRPERNNLGRAIGTALLIERAGLQRDLWQSELDMVELVGTEGESARRLDIFLDLLANEADAGWQHLLDPTFSELLTDDEAGLRDVLMPVVQMADAAVSPAWIPLKRAIEAYRTSDS